MAADGTMVGLALAGGRSSRFGGEKAAALLHGQPLLLHATARLATTCRAVAVSAPPGSEAQRLATGAGLAVLHDKAGWPSGPLAGIAAGLAWAADQGAALLAIAPCDMPCAPADLYARLTSALEDDDGAAVARTPDGLQSLCAVVRTAVGPALAALLDVGEHPPVHEWLADIRAREVEFPGDGFANVNTPQDLTGL